LTPEDRHLAERRRADEEKERLIAERAAQIKAEHGPELERQAEIRLIENLETRKAAADEMARILAERGVRPGNIDWRDHREVPDEAIGKVLAAHEQDPRQQREAEEARKQQLLDNAKALGVKDDAAAASWVAQAETLDRQRHRSGRYDPLKSVPPSNSQSSSRGGSPNDPPPRDPTSPTKSPPPGPTKGPLSANEVLQRFGDPDLEARYEQQEQQRREQQFSSGSTTPDTAASVATRGNVPMEKRKEYEKFVSEYKGGKFVRDLYDDDNSRDRDHSHRGGRSRGGGGRSR
jgi:hypothetical protein